MINIFFFTAGGAIGTDDDIKVELGDEVLNRFRFTEKEFNIKDTLEVTLACLKTAPLKISLPILSLNFLAPLTSIFEEVGIPIGFLTWVLGQPQCKKTSLVSAINSHFGNFARNQAPLSFLDGVPSMIYKSAELRDVPALCDDFYPSTNKQEATQMKKSANALISLSFDRITGSRSKSNGEIRKNYRQSSMIITTGELFPDLGQSRTSRVLFINIEKNDVKNKELTYIQHHQEELQYTMKKNIQAIISNIEDVKVEIKTIFYEKTEEANKQITMRTAEMISSLYVGYKMLIDFALENGVVNQNEAQKLLEEGWQVLIEVGKEQNETVENVSPINMVISAIEVLASTKKILVVDRESAPYIKLKEIYKPEFIGFYDRERESAFVYPDLLYKKIRDFYRQQGVDFPFNKSTICKELMTNGFLYKTEKQDRPQVRMKNPITQKEETTVGLLTNKIYIPCIYNESGTIKER